MSHCWNLFDWRLHVPQSLVTLEGAAYLDVVCSLANADVDYYHYSTMNGCDLFDVVRMLDWVDDRGLVTAGERSLFNSTRTALLNRPEFMTADEVAARLANSDGHCPLCSSRVSFHTEPDSDGYFHVLSHCHHFRIGAVKDVEDVLRNYPGAWEGARWPHYFGERTAKANGEPLRPGRISHHCRNCRTADATRVFQSKVEAVLTELVIAGQNPDWRGLGSSPVSRQHCTRCSDGIVHTSSLCEHERVGISRLASEIVTGEQGEFRLNGAGLKLYTRGVRVTFMDGEITFSMNVWGDQRDSYPAFVEFANRRFAELELHQYSSKKS